MKNNELIITILALTMLSKESLSENLHQSEIYRIKSISSDYKTTINFINKSNEEIKIFWIDFNGNRKFYKNLKPYEKYKEITYLTHVWLTTDKDNNAKEIYFPDSKERIIIIE